MTNPIRIFNGHLHSPFFIFLRAAGRFSDQELLSLLGLNDFVADPLVDDLSRPQLFITEDLEWIHIADDWYYSLWHRGRDRVLDRIHAKHPELSIFACTFPDSDESFDFSFYALGKLQRKYVVEDPHYDIHRRIVRADFGEPLAWETELSRISEVQRYLLALAKLVGVKIDHQAEKIRCYAGPLRRQGTVQNPLSNALHNF